MLCAAGGSRAQPCSSRKGHCVCKALGAAGKPFPVPEEADMSIRYPSQTFKQIARKKSLATFAIGMALTIAIVTALI